MSKYADVIKEARKPESQVASIPGSTPEPEVNMTIKVPKALRRHWVAEAKRQDTSLRAAIIEAMKAKFGEPH